MNEVHARLLEIIDREDHPAEVVSSHWQLFGEKNVVRKDGDTLVLEPFGIGSVSHVGPASQVLRLVERLSYLGYTRRSPNYRDTWSAARQLAGELSFGLTLDVWRQSVVLAVLRDHWREQGLSPSTFALIGDGHGFLGALIRRCVPAATIYCIDLPKMLAFQVRTHEIAGARSMSLLDGPRRSDPSDVIFVPPQHVHSVPGPIDCAVNVASMQEMTPASIESYFTFLRERSTPDSHFYCVNRAHKELPGGEVLRFVDFPWRSDDQVFLSGPCPYYKWFISGSTRSNGPRVLGVRIPLVNHFDGEHMHRLVRLAPAE